MYDSEKTRIHIEKALKGTDGVLMRIDLDGFAAVNDKFGKDKGDRILEYFTKIVSDNIRSDDIAGSLGGDDYVIFCRYINDESVIAAKTANMNRELYRACKDILGEEELSPIGVSLGASICPDEGRDYETLYKKASAALDDVKKTGKHGYKLSSKYKVEKWDAPKAHSSVGNEMVVLSERARKKGAYELTYEQFKLIYRFLSRVELNYHKKNHLVLFTVRDIDEYEEDMGSFADRFLKCVCSCLRASDVACRKGKNQLLVILLEASDADARKVAQRVIKNWMSQGPDLPEPAYEMDIVM